MSKTHQGRYVLKNPSKYEGDPTNVIYRSSWELRVMIKFDTHPSVLSWGSEELVIPYYWEGDGKWHRYFTDFVATMNTTQGKKRVVIEVKPYAQTQEPVNKKNKRRTTLINEVQTYSKNKAKWLAAEEYCKDRYWEFLILTEREIFNGKVW